jgi:hypothetical protein
VIVLVSEVSGSVAEAIVGDAVGIGPCATGTALRGIPTVSGSQTLVGEKFAGLPPTSG